MKQAHIFISGTVQGVGFRYFIKSWARTFGVAGWASNDPGGGLEAIFQGEDQSVKDLIEKCRKGPFLAEVKGFDIKWEEVSDALADFQIK